MSLRVLLTGGPVPRRDAIAAWLDAAFDLDLETVPGPVEALTLLPNRDFALIVVMAQGEDGRASGMDLVRFLSQHARHQRTPVVFVGGERGHRDSARAMGACLLEEGATEEDVRGLARDVLGLG